METVLIFANPIAGRGKGRAMADLIGERLRQDGYDVQIHLERADAIDLEQLPEAARAAVVIGGDGTLRTVADRLLGRAGAVPPLLPVPLGTANLMGQHLGIRWGSDGMAAQISQAIANRQLRWLDAARANGTLFLLMVGVGFDAQVVHELARIRTGPIQLASYVLPAALAVSAYRYPSITVVADGQEVFEAAPGVAFVGNAREYGTGFPILPLARPDDGILDVCVLPCNSPVELTRWFLLAAAGEHLYTEGAIYLQARHVSITSEVSVPVQVDGDACGHSPVEINLLPVRLPFIVP